MKIIIGENEAEQRFDRFLRKYFKINPDVKLTDIYSWIRKGAIKLNGRKSKQDTRLKIGDEIRFDASIESDKKPEKPNKTKKERFIDIDVNKIKKQIIYEDENRVFWNKPAGLVVHPGNKHLDDITLNDLLIKYLGEHDSKKSDTFTPSFGFRLDKDTSGIIVGAKNYDALQYLNKIIRERQVKKNYLAIIKGNCKNKIKIDQPLFRGMNKKYGRAQSFVDPQRGKEAITIIKKIRHIDNKHLGIISLVKVEILTGRMHQIRAHLSHIKHPIIGDILYGDQGINQIANKKHKIDRQLLHSLSYGFFDKYQYKRIIIKSEIPKDFQILFSNINLDET